MFLLYRQGDCVDPAATADSKVPLSCHHDGCVTTNAVLFRHSSQTHIEMCDHHSFSLMVY